jgi:hypothetical protein
MKVARKIRSKWSDDGKGRKFPRGNRKIRAGNNNQHT